MDVRSTGIIGHTSAVRMNYRKWAGPSINTIDLSHSEFQVWCVTGSGSYTSACRLFSRTPDLSKRTLSLSAQVAYILATYSSRQEQADSPKRLTENT